MSAAMTPPEGEPKPGFISAGIGYYRSVMVEMHKVTWPDWPHVRSATISIVVFVLAIGAMISLMDGVLYELLQRLIPSLFAGR
jgi:preprotein translocase SecE subunit